MGKLLTRIRRAVAEERFVVGTHADDRMRERKAEFWQLIAEIDRAKLVTERPDDEPHPTVVVEQTLADGTPVRVVWAWIGELRLAKIVTVHLIG